MPGIADNAEGTMYEQTQPVTDRSYGSDAVPDYDGLLDFEDDETEVASCGSSPLLSVVPKALDDEDWDVPHDLVSGALAERHDNGDDGGGVELVADIETAEDGEERSEGEPGSGEDEDIEYSEGEEDEGEERERCETEAGNVNE